MRLASMNGRVFKYEFSVSCNFLQYFCYIHLFFNYIKYITMFYSINIDPCSCSTAKKEMLLIIFQATNKASKIEAVLIFIISFAVE